MILFSRVVSVRLAVLPGFARAEKRSENVDQTALVNSARTCMNTPTRMCSASDETDLVVQDLLEEKMTKHILTTATMT